MMNKLNNAKKAAAAAVVLAALAGVSTEAAAYNVFTVNPGNFGEVKKIGGTAAHPVTALVTPFSADKMTGNYTEIITVGPSGNTFNVSILWEVGQFAANNGATVLNGTSTTGLGYSYGMYLTFQGSGTITPTATGNHFNLTPGGSTLKLWLDTTADNSYTAPALGTGSWTVTDPSTGVSGEQDVLLATGVGTYGLGNLDPTLPTCTSSGGINCGSFGQTSTFALTTLGKSFFTSPTVFYNTAYQSGQLDNFSPSGTQTITGSLDWTFANTVSEPDSLLVLGMGLMGLAASTRRRRAA